MGQSSSKNRRKIRKENRTLRVPVYNGSFGRGYKFKSDGATLTIPAENGVRNKFHSAPRTRPRSNEDSSKGVIVYSSTDNGQPIARIQHRPQTRATVQQVFEQRNPDQPKHHPAQRGYESHTSHPRSPDPRNTINKFTTYRSYNQLTVSELNNRKTGSIPSHRNQVFADGHMTNHKRSGEVTSHNTNHKVSGEVKSHNTNHKRSGEVISHNTNHKRSGEVTSHMTNHRRAGEVTGHMTNPKRSADVTGHMANPKKSGEVSGRRVQNHQVYRHVPDSGYKSLTSPNRPPFLPPWGTKKDMVPDPRMFEAIDIHAMKCPEKACTSLRSLATYLTQNAKNDLQRIRVIFRWITCSVRYDMNAVLAGTYKSMPCDPLAVLHTRKAVCQGFANLFAALCREVDLMVKILTGFSKDFFYDPERPFQSYGDCNHAWNLVYVHGEWRPVDCTWASGYIDDHNHFRSRYNDFYFLTDPEIFVWSHFPFVSDGLKSSLQYQLLARPVSILDFNRKISPSQPAMEWGMESLTHRENIIEVHRLVKIEFRVRKVKLMNLAANLKNTTTGEDFDRYIVARRKQDGSFSVTVYPPTEGTYRLRIYGHPLGENHFYLTSLVSYSLQCLASISRIQPYPENDGLWGVKVNAERYGFAEDIYRNDFLISETGELEFNIGMLKHVTTMFKLYHAVHDIPDLNDYVTTEYSYSRMKVKVRFPRAGYYKLSLFGKPPGSLDNRVDLIADYLVQCKVALPNCKPFPKSFPFAQSSMCILVEPQSGILPANKTVEFIINSAELKRVLVDGKGAPPFSSGVFQGEIEPKAGGSIVSIFGNTTGGMDHDELYRFAVEDTRQTVAI